MPMRYDDLSSLTPVVRKEVLTGELMRRVRTLDIVPSTELDALVESLTTTSLSEVLQTIDDPERLKDQVESWKKNNLKPVDASPPPKSSVPSASASQDSLLANPDATASAPEHPSTPISVDAALSTPPRTSSPSGSVPPLSERDRIYQAVCRLEKNKQSDLTDLVMSLPKRERALCLFNTEVLKTKLTDAKLVLESDEDNNTGGLQERTPVEPRAKSTPPVTPQTKRIVSGAGTGESPKTPDLSSRGASATASPLPTTPSTSTSTAVGSSSSGTWTVAALAKLSALEIVKVASDPKVVLPRGVSKADPIVMQTTNEFVDGLSDKPVQQQKQQLGDKLCVVFVGPDNTSSR
jgi:polyadenylate-binding protein